jgi:hypothetical protein
MLEGGMPGTMGRDSEKATSERTAESLDARDTLRRGIAAARAGAYAEGLTLLAEACEALTHDPNARVPAAALSLYGLCLAKEKRRTKDAVRFCEAAIGREFYNGEHYANLAEVWLEGRSRRHAVEVIGRGLAVDAVNARLRELRHELGVRRRPVIFFLARENPVNVFLGRLRRALSPPPSSKSHRR